MRTCAVEECGRAVIARGWCGKHWARWARHGDPLYESRRPNGAGTVRKDGYIERTAQGARTLEHVRVAEAALGKPLPKDAIVHHLDENPSNNAPTNLVVCPSQAYHLLLHQRQRALDGCGHADWRRCYVCGEYDSPERLRVRPGAGAFHMACAAKDTRERYARRASHTTERTA